MGKGQMVNLILYVVFPLLIYPTPLSPRSTGFIYFTCHFQISSQELEENLSWELLNAMGQSVLTLTETFECITLKNSVEMFEINSR